MGFMNFVDELVTNVRDANERMNESMSNMGFESMETEEDGECRRCGCPTSVSELSENGGVCGICFDPSRDDF